MKRIRSWEVAVVLLVVLGGLGAGVAWSQAQEEPVLVIGVTGGIYEDIQRKVFFEPFMKATGIKIVTVANPSLAKIKAMVETRNVDVDLVEVPGNDMRILAHRGLSEKLDYDQIPKETLDGIYKQGIHPNGLGMFVYATGIAFSTKTYTAERHPQSWSEFWDVQKFPGARTLPTPAWMISSFEMALLADGVPPDKLYPLDVDRAFRSLDRIRPHVTKWYRAGAEAGQFLTDGHGDLAAMGLGRLLATKERGGAVDIEYNQSLVQINYWVIPKGARHYQNAMKFIAFYHEPKRLGEYTNAYPSLSPINWKAVPFVAPTRLPMLVTAPENISRMVWVDEGWWAEEDSSGKSNYEKVFERWNVWILGQ